MNIILGFIGVVLATLTGLYFLEQQLTRPAPSLAETTWKQFVASDVPDNKQRRRISASQRPIFIQGQPDVDQKQCLEVLVGGHEQDGGYIFKFERRLGETYQFSEAYPTAN
jgi:hypothetical protein